MTKGVLIQLMKTLRLLTWSDYRGRGESDKHFHTCLCVIGMLKSFAKNKCNKTCALAV